LVRTEADTVEWMTITGFWRTCVGRYHPGSEVHLAGRAACSSIPPLVVLATAVGISEPVYVVQTRTIDGGASFWVTESALTSLTVGILAARDASSAAATDGVLVAKAVGGARPYVYSLTRAAAHYGGDDSDGEGRVVVDGSDGRTQTGSAAEFQGLGCGAYVVEVVDRFGLRAEQEVTIYDSECRGRTVDMDAAKGAMCAICCAAPRNALLLPCSHMGMCMSCARRAMRESRKAGTPNGACPFCRGSICGMVEVIWT
jgi:hypothetical protein